MRDEDRVVRGSDVASGFSTANDGVLITALPR